jgi:iron complex transport system ATP-binding protein
MKKLLEVVNLGFSYNAQRRIFQGVDFSLSEGEIMSILGPNGAGKSTLLNCVANLLKPTEGEILLEGAPLHSIKPNEVARIIGYVPQIHIPAYEFTVRDFVVMGRAPYIGAFSKPSDNDYVMVEDALKMLQISHLADKIYTEISGGERQLATIARAIVQKPKIILLDEPTAHLDYGNQLRAVNLIKKLAGMGFSIIITTHQPDHAMMLEGYTGIMNYNGVMIFGETKEVVKEELLTKLYNTKIKLISVPEVKRKLCIPLE